MFIIFGMCVKLKSVNQMGKKFKTFIVFSGIMSFILNIENTLFCRNLYIKSLTHTLKLSYRSTDKESKSYFQMQFVCLVVSELPPTTGDTSTCA